MAIEIERKFLVANDDWKTDETGAVLVGTWFRQGYLSDGEATVRVRIEGEQGKLTIKGKTTGMSRLEFEYDIPLDDAMQMLDELCQQPLIEKTRFLRYENNQLWEIDVFAGANEGLIIAEVELETETATVNLPAWVGAEVTGDNRYYNVNLAKHPFAQW